MHSCDYVPFWDIEVIDHYNNDRVMTLWESAVTLEEAIAAVRGIGLPVMSVYWDDNEHHFLVGVDRREE